MDAQPKSTRFDARDALAAIGVGLITGGVAMLHVPAALIVCGALLLVGAVMAARR